MFLVVEGEDFIYVCLIPPLLFIFKVQYLLCSRTQNVTIKRALNEKIDSMINERNPILVTLFLGSE